MILGNLNYFMTPSFLLKDNSSCGLFIVAGLWRKYWTDSLQDTKTRWETETRELFTEVTRFLHSSHSFGTNASANVLNKFALPHSRLSPLIRIVDRRKEGALEQKYRPDHFHQQLRWRWEESKKLQSRQEFHSKFSFFLCVFFHSRRINRAKKGEVKATATSSFDAEQVLPHVKKNVTNCDNNPKQSSVELSICILTTVSAVENLHQKSCVSGIKKLFHELPIFA